MRVSLARGHAGLNEGHMCVQAVLLACEKLRDALGPVAADKGGDLSWAELAAAAQGDANGFGPSKARHALCIPCWRW